MWGAENSVCCYSRVRRVQRQILCASSEVYGKSPPAAGDWTVSFPVWEEFVSQILGKQKKTRGGQSADWREVPDVWPSVRLDPGEAAQVISVWDACLFAKWSSCARLPSLWNIL
ncbi:unnamed protein product [Caretta caretta]